MALKVKGLYAAEKLEHSGSVATKLEWTDEDRVLMRQLVDASITKLMEAQHEIVLRIGEVAPQAGWHSRFSYWGQRTESRGEA